MPVHGAQVKIECCVGYLHLALHTYRNPDPCHQPTDQMTSVYRRNEVKKGVGGTRRNKIAHPDKLFPNDHLSCQEYQRQDTRE